MADLTGDAVANNFEQINAGVNGLGPRTQIVSVSKASGDATEAELVAVIKALGIGTEVTVGGETTRDTFTVAGIAGTIGTDPVYLALQGTGVVGTTEDDYATGVTLAVVADFDQTFVGAA